MTRIRESASENGSANPSLDWLLDTYGARRTFRMCMRLGGVRHYVPRADRGSDGRIAQFFTADDLRPLQELYGGSYITFPLAHHFCANFLSWVEGRSVVDICLTLRMHHSRMHEVIARKPPAYLTGVVLAGDEQRRQARLSSAALRRHVFNLLGLSQEAERHHEVA